MQVPDGWQVVRLGNVVEVVTGNTPPRETSEYYGGDIPWVKPSDLASSRLVDSSEEYLTEAGAVVARQIPENCVLVSCIGTIGEVAISRVPLCFNQQINALIPSDAVWPPFLYWACNGQASRLLSMSAKTAVPILNKSAFSAVSISLPPLPEQRAIAAVLDSIDEAIERTEAVIAATERLRDALLHQLLTRGVPGWHTQWKDVPGIGTIPASWEVVRLGEVLESTTYGTNEPLSTRGEMVVLRMNNLQNGEINLSEVRRADLSKKEVHELNLVPGDILFNRTNSLDLVGKVGVVRDLPELISFASYLIRLRTVASHANSFWLSALLWSANCQSRIRRFATPGVSQANINPTSLGSLTIPLPPLPEQEATAKLLDGVDVTLAAARREREGLQLLKESTADALLTGRVRVEVGERIHDQ